MQKSARLSARWGISAVVATMPDREVLTPMYGPAVRCKRVSPIWVLDLASMYPASDWSICSGPSWISARVRSYYRTSLKWTIWVTSVRSRREDRPPSLRFLSQTSAGKLGLLRLHRVAPLGSPHFSGSTSGLSLVPTCACSAAASGELVMVNSILARRFEATP
jgi:hypothetical protein